MSAITVHEHEEANDDATVASAIVVETLPDDHNHTINAEIIVAEPAEPDLSSMLNNRTTTTTTTTKNNNDDNNNNHVISNAISSSPPPSSTIISNKYICLQERIIFIIDADKEATELYTKRKSRLEVIKDCMSIFVENKLSMPNHPSKIVEFSIYILGEHIGCFMNFSSNKREILNAIDKIDIVGDSKGAPVDFSSICELVEIKTDNMMRENNNSSVYHIIFVYTRSNSVPFWSRGKRSHRDFLINSNVVWDIFFLHTKSKDEQVQQKAKEVFLSLCDIADISDLVNMEEEEEYNKKYPSYIFARSAGGHKLYLEFAMLMAHPAIRDIQPTSNPLIFEDKVKFKRPS